MNSPQPDRLPPHAPEAERGVLGVVIDTPDALHDATGVTTEWFYELRHQQIWDAIVALGGKGAKWDFVGLIARLRDLGILEGVGGVAYLSQMQEEVPSRDNLGYYVEILAEKHRLRRVLDICVRTSASMFDGETPADSIIASAQAGILEVTETAVEEKEKSLRELMPGVIDLLERFAQGHKVMAGYTTGFNYLDNMMAGWENGQMYVIAGRPSTGKTSLCVDFILHFAKTHGPVAFFSKEMTQVQVALRSLANYSQKDFQTFRNGFIADGDAPRMVQAAGDLCMLPVYIDQSSGLNGQQILMRTRRMIRLYGVKAIFIDYLQLMGSTEKYREKRDRVADASEWCKRIAKSLNIPVIVLAQLNREVEKGNKARPPQLSDLAESGDIEQDADFVAALWRPKIDTEILDPREVSINEAKERLRRMGDESKREFFWVKHLDAGPKENNEPMHDHVSLVSLSVLKQRNGPTGECALVFYRRQMRFADAGRP